MPYNMSTDFVSPAMAGLKSRCRQKKVPFSIPGILFSTLIAAALLTGGCSENNSEKKQKLFKSGLKYLEKEDYPSAVIQFKNVIELDPTSGEGYYRLGLSYYKMGNFPKAYKELSRAVEQAPHIIDAQVKLGEIYILYRKPEEAEETAKKLLRKDAANWQGWLIYGNANKLKDENEIAEKAFNRAIEIAPDELLPQLSKARLFEKRRECSCLRRTSSR